MWSADHWHVPLPALTVTNSLQFWALLCFSVSQLLYSLECKMSFFLPIAAKKWHPLQLQRNQYHFIIKSLPPISANKSVPNVTIVSVLCIFFLHNSLRKTLNALSTLHKELFTYIQRNICTYTKIQAHEKAYDNISHAATLDSIYMLHFPLRVRDFVKTLKEGSSCSMPFCSLYFSY